MDDQGKKNSNSNSSGSKIKQQQLFSLLGQNSEQIRPYQSKFQMKSIGSGSRASRDSDLLNRLCQDQSKSSKSLSRNASISQFQNHKSLMNSSSNSISSQKSASNRIKNQSIQSGDIINKDKICKVKQAPKIHNCVCFAAGQCLYYNCNCFLSPFQCPPECCPNCLILKSNLPNKISNMCSCKKTKCLKLYCQCLSKGQFCSVMCRCQFCQNHQHNKTRMASLNSLALLNGCSCSKSKCIKKYCQCYSQGIKCTRKCVCIGCKNFIQQPSPPSNNHHNHHTNQDISKITNNIKNANIQYQQMVDVEFEEVDFYSGMRLG